MFVKLYVFQADLIVKKKAVGQIGNFSNAVNCMLEEVIEQQTSQS